MKGDPRKPQYFRWFSLAVQRGLRITRLYEYYMETMDISYRRQLPKQLLMYFAYNDNSLGDARKAYVYASVITYKDRDPQTYESYKDTMKRFANARWRMARSMRIMQFCIRNSFWNQWVEKMRKKSQKNCLPAVFTAMIQRCAR